MIERDEEKRTSDACNAVVHSELVGKEGEQRTQRKEEEEIEGGERKNRRSDEAYKSEIVGEGSYGVVSRIRYE